MRRQMPQVSVRVLVAGTLNDHHPEGFGDIVTDKLLPDGVFLHVKASLQHRLHDLRRLRLLDIRQRGHDGHLQLSGLGGRGALRHHLVPAALSLEELPVQLEGLPKGGRLRNLHLVHPHGDLIRPELLAVQFHVQQPIVLFCLIAERAIDQVAAGGVIHSQQFLGVEVVGACQLQDLRAGDGQGIDLILEFPVLVIPDNDSALIEFRQWCRELAVQVLNDLVSVHLDNLLTIFFYQGRQHCR